ncbi:MAG: PhnD/SsuA/transferrin family substrate-binding protein [Hyphomicrobiales bacterium]|nr:PhnD/SsuA/transferrin family substrate-binding protein [Hyphomicrobiales bacterium]
MFGIVVALFAVAAHAADAPRLLRIGVLAYRGSEDAERTFETTVAQLARALPHYRVEMIAGSAAFLTTQIARDEIDFVVTNPGHYLELAIDYSATAIATVQDMDGTSASEAVGATILAPTNLGEIQSIADLKGRRIAAVAPEAFGFRAAWLEFLDRGVDPFKDARPLFVGFPVDGVVDAVRAGRADAGIVRSCLLEKLIAEGKVKPEEFRVVGRRPSGTLNCQVSTRLYPGWPFVKVAQTSPAMARQVADALLAMQPSSGDIVWSAPESYHRVQDLYRALKVGPYAPFTRLGILDFLWEYRWWGIAASMAALWWLVHVTRVAHLLRRRTAELQAAHEKARLEAERMEHTVRLSLMGEMASSLAHEINQPLAAILSYARGCERRLDAGIDPDGVREGVRRIALQAERAGSMVKRMRDFVRKTPSRQLPIDPAVIVADALALFEPTAAARGVTVEADLTGPLPIVRADRLQIEEVLLNLLQNALEAAAGRPDPEIVLSARVVDHAVLIAVTDNGPGVPPEARDSLFDAFFTTKPEGLGLGLSLSRTIAEAHGGRLDPDFDTPGATTFRFRLPLIEEEDHV